ncbi:YraN family protein [Acinetobacter qingfengensis]|uniref:UPF0102 protein BJI46_12870 n=1 Tax=Acinetobacter qingfengensis TaxID=1262585 RepID=A0A1E7R8A9_9GAMM|nr:YraN family protein [Acinetobacter qingfengensis]KAA8731418.1 YraN family protein [Acinetobacter qingfengensis]OEY95522.1 YraN family protein [Acinetobacter qingfengensis]
MQKQNIGQWAEQLALDYLLTQGLSLIKQNYHSRWGEIDLIMLDGNHLCFIEVKARKLYGMVDALEAVDVYKQQKTILTAQYFLQRYPEYENFDCQFDVVALNYTKRADLSKKWIDLLQQNTVNLQWLRHAYTM